MRGRSAIRLGVVIAALAAGAPASVWAQTGQSGACTVSDTRPDAPAIWSSSSQSLWGCEGWVYAFAVRNQRVTYGRWNGARAISVSANGVALTADDGAEPLAWKLDIVDYLQTLVDDGRRDVDQFWRGLVAAEARAVKQFARASPALYTSPRRVAFLADSTPTPCGVIAADNAHYCSGDSTVYLGRAFFLGELSLGGNFLPILILSHEWGHHIQNILDLNPVGIPRSLNSTNIELQADCFAGLYAADAARRGLLDPGDADQAANSLYRAGDGEKYPWFTEGAHGTADERIAAWHYGQQHGLAGCLNQMFADQ